MKELEQLMHAANQMADCVDANLDAMDESAPRCLEILMHAIRRVNESKDKWKTDVVWIDGYRRGLDDAVRIVARSKEKPQLMEQHA